MLDALVRTDDLRPDIELVLVTHESVAVATAEGAARLTGRPAVAYLHTTAGMANGLAHLIDAQLARTPVLVLNGLMAGALPGRDGFTTAAHPADMVRQHVKRTWLRSDRHGRALARLGALDAATLRLAVAGGVGALLAVALVFVGYRRGCIR